MLKNGPFLSNQRFKKGTFLKKKKRFYFFIKLFLHTFCYLTTAFKSLITHKWFILKKVTFHIVNVKRVVL